MLSSPQTDDNHTSADYIMCSMVLHTKHTPLSLHAHTLTHQLCQEALPPPFVEKLLFLYLTV